MEQTGATINHQYYENGRDPRLAVSQKNNNKLRKFDLKNKWNPKPINAYNGYEYEHPSSGLQTPTELTNALKEYNIKLTGSNFYSNELLSSSPAKSENREEHLSPRRTENIDENKSAETKNNLLSIRRRTLAPVYSQSISPHYSQFDTPRSRTSSVQSADENFLQETILCDSSKISSGMMADTADDIDRKITFQNGVKSQLVSSPWTSQHTQPRGTEMNFIMLLGLFVGLLVAKTLQYLQMYFGWFLNQLQQIRNALMGTLSIWDFLDLEDNTRYNRRTKLFRIPLILLCNFLYALISILYFTARFLLAPAPGGLISFVQKFYK